jgi:hypothetical protein
MKTRHKNITEHPDGYLVRMVRGSLKCSAFIPYSRKNALAAAIAERDRFKEICGPVAAHGLRPKAHSNTGIVGVSETVHSRNGRDLNCFISHARGRNKRFYFGWKLPRGAALQKAVAHRLQATGQSTATQPAIYI